MAAGADEEVCAERALKRVDLFAERWLGDVEARGGAAEVELLSDGQEVAQEARFEIDSPKANDRAGYRSWSEPASSA